MGGLGKDNLLLGAHTVLSQAGQLSSARQLKVTELGKPQLRNVVGRPGSGGRGKHWELGPGIYRLEGVTPAKTPFFVLVTGQNVRQLTRAETADLVDQLRSGTPLDWLLTWLQAA